MTVNRLPNGGLRPWVCRTVEFLHAQGRRCRSVMTTSSILVTIGATCAFVYADPPKPTQQIYQTAASILALSPEQASREEPAHLRGVVTLCAENGGLVIEDHTAGIWINSVLHLPCDPGDEIEIQGVVGPGMYTPVVRAISIRKLGHSPLPKPHPVTFKQMSTGDEDDQYVSIEGVVRSSGLHRSDSIWQRVWLKIEMADGFVYASFPAADAEAGSKLIDAVVRIEGATLCMKNEKGQLTAPSFLMATGMQHLTVLRPPPQDLFALPLTPISRLMRYRSGTDYAHRVRIAGIVTYYKPGESLILEEDGRGLLVTTAQTSDIKIGDRIEALGFPTLQASGPIVQDAVLRYIAPGQQLQPATVKIEDLAYGEWNNNLVSTQGRLLRRVHEPYREVLLIQDKSNLLLTELAKPDNPSILAKIQEGSTIRITGVTFLEVTDNWKPGHLSASAVHYKLLLRSASDIQLIDLPSWWSTQHVIYVASILSLACLALVAFSRMERWRLQSVLNERERMAHEIHDTLAQSFAGIGFQLQAISKEIPSQLPGLRQQVDLARALVRHSHAEAKRSVEPPSPEPLEKIDLLSALESSARAMVEGGSVEVSADCTGAQRSIPPQMVFSLVRIGQEAISNAVRHADPTHLEIAVVYEKHTVRLAVTDNGCGFVESGDLLGFGLRGMHKRAAALSARLEIVSYPGRGTRIEVIAPLPHNFTLLAFLRRAWRHLVEGILHVNIETR